MDWCLHSNKAWIKGISSDVLPNEMKTNKFRWNDRSQWSHDPLFDMFISPRYFCCSNAYLTNSRRSFSFYQIRRGSKCVGNATRHLKYGGRSSCHLKFRIAVLSGFFFTFWHFIFRCDSIVIRERIRRIEKYFIVTHSSYTPRSAANKNVHRQQYVIMFFFCMNMYAILVCVHAPHGFNLSTATS